MTQYLSGLQMTDAGQMTCLNGAGGVPAGSPRPPSLFAGWATDGTGKPYVENLGASSVPAAAVKSGGIAFHQDGRMYVTTQAPATADVSVSGMNVRQDGALRVSTSAVAAGDQFVGGWAVAQTGAARMGIT